MSQQASGSSVSSKASHGVTGIPKYCWCGSSVVIKLSKSETNPYRRFYRCAMAASKKLSDDKHVFKWLDDAIINEIETLTNGFARLENEIKTMSSYMEDQERFAREKVEAEVVENRDGKMAKWGLQVLMVFVVGVCVGIVSVKKMFG